MKTWAQTHPNIMTAVFAMLFLFSCGMITLAFIFKSGTLIIILNIALAAIFLTKAEDWYERT